ncbi:MAG: type II secretion system F family protein [Planctomycetota bacterium]|jgi:type IV pilus assembly protein PilC
MGQKLSQVYYNLSILLDGGVPILRSLKTILPPLKGKLKKGFKGVYESVNQGESVSEGMVKYPRVFVPLDVSIVKAADTSGNLPGSLKMLSDWYEFKNKLKRITKTGFALPFVVLHIMAFAPPFLFYVAGQVSFNSFCKSAISTLAIFYIPGVVIYAIFKFTPKKGFLRRSLDEVLQFIPILGRSLMYLALSRFCRSFYILYSAGVPITKCTEISTEATGNTAVAELLKGGIQCCQAGKPISEGFSKNLPSEFLGLWLIGEESGDMDKVAKKMAEYTSEKAEYSLTEIIKWMPRLVYAIMCIMIIIKIFYFFGMISSGYSGAI